MEKSRHRPQSAARRDRIVVYQWRHALNMEGIWSELAPLDPWQTSVLSGAYSFPETHNLSVS